MREVRIESKFSIYESTDDLLPSERNLMQKAIKMLDNAYAPYSKFYVGAAVLTTSGNIYVGCNQENASYPLCICGERVALFNAGANEPQEPIKLLAIVCHNPRKKVDQPVSPCGACRQVIAEFELRHSSPYPILLKGDTKKIYKTDSTRMCTVSQDDDLHLSGFH